MCSSVNRNAAPLPRVCKIPHPIYGELSRHRIKRTEKNAMDRCYTHKVKETPRFTLRQPFSFSFSSSRNLGLPPIPRPHRHLSFASWTPAHTAPQNNEQTPLSNKLGTSLGSPCCESLSRTTVSATAYFETWRELKFHLQPTRGGSAFSILARKFPVRITVNYSLFPSLSKEFISTVSGSGMAC